MWEAQDIFPSTVPHACLQPALFSFRLRPTWTARPQFSWWTSLSLLQLSCSTSRQPSAITSRQPSAISDSNPLPHANQPAIVYTQTLTKPDSSAWRDESGLPCQSWGRWVFIMCNATHRYMVSTLGQCCGRTAAGGCTRCLWSCFSRSIMGLGGTSRRWSLIISGGILHSQSVCG